MKLQRCANGRFYDGDKYPTCPHCQDAGLPGFKDDEEWTYLTKIFGSNAIPAESAATITKAIKKAEKDGAITSKNRWQLIEMLATEYLAGK